MVTTTTRIQEINNNEALWSGRFHFLIDLDCEIEYLKGGVGGFVSAISLATTRESFLVKVFAALKKLQASANEEYEEIEDISSKYQSGDLSDEWMNLCKLAIETDDVAFNEFDVYMAE